MEEFRNCQDWASILVVLMMILPITQAKVDHEGMTEIRVENLHRMYSVTLLILLFLLLVTVITAWQFKARRMRFLHETGLAMIYGVIMGAIIKYSTQPDQQDYPIQCSLNKTNGSLPLLLSASLENVSYSYQLLAIHDRESPATAESPLVETMIFDPEIFFYVLLPPVIFYAGYDLRHFPLLYVASAIMYLFISNIQPIGDFGFIDCLIFGAMISATDPVTVLAIFHDLHVDSKLYALVFGESVLNDAVAIVLYRIREFPLLETAVFIIFSYSAFLIAEALRLTGIVTILFCGITQSHFTYKNLSDESQKRTKQAFEIINFLAENFIFSYMGLSFFVFPYHRWYFGFIAFSFIAIFVGRLCNIYPLSFILNRTRRNKISYNIQHMMVFAGLRGAIAFALAIRNTSSESRQLMFTTTLMIVFVTVLFNGGTTTLMLRWLRIDLAGSEDERDQAETAPETAPETENPNASVSSKDGNRSLLARSFINFDKKYPNFISLISCYLKYLSPIFVHSSKNPFEGTRFQRWGNCFKTMDEEDRDNLVEMASA
ncbi:Sodium/hydrogen exchanger 9 [Trichoplax sp. H2]|nr:Sodium/hydrogen exchanger 9 [Trichoplax sp. H2]|eukprot:RDD41277.1 Sodium/hydrogen exchanger 9 [Trichoplax sp. H2]